MPWTKKNSSSSKLKHKFHLGWLAFYFSMIFILASINAKTGYRKYTSSYPIPWEEYFKQVPGLLLFSGITSFLIYLVGLKFGFGERKYETLMCDKCERVKLIDNESKCECGGTFYPINNFEWKSDDNT
jgi:hypothetical protein